MKKTCSAELEIDKTIATLTSKVDKFETVLRLNVITNVDETNTTLKKKKNDLAKAVKRKYSLSRNRANQKAFRDRKKQTLKEFAETG